jgi:hypothetical protein
MTPEETATKIVDLLNSAGGQTRGFARAELLPDVDGVVIGVEIDGDLAFVEVQSA